MKKGEKAVLTIKPEYGYGEEGSPPTIPANATLQFEVELLSWNSVKDITPAKDGGIIKTVVTEGEGWASPKDNDEVLGNLNVKFHCLMCMLEWLVIIRAKQICGRVCCIQAGINVCHHASVPFTNTHLAQ